MGNNATIVLGVFSFYAAIVVVAGLVGAGLIVSQLPVLEEPSTIGFLSQIGLFFEGIFFTFGGIPAWANTLLFLPLGITLTYIFLSYLRGSS